jgi:hypothetical protein
MPLFCFIRNKSCKKQILQSNRLFRKSAGIYIGLLLCAILFCQQNTLFAQEKFSVIAGNTKVEYKLGNSAWKVYAAKDELIEGMTIRMKKPGYIALWGSAGTMLELRRAGEYSLKSAADKGLADGTDKLKKYLMDSFLQEQTRNSYAGAIKRGILRNAEIVFPFETKIMENTVIFRWHSAHERGAQYRFELTNNNRKLLYSKVLKDTVLRLDLNSLSGDSWVKGQCLYWTVMAYTGMEKPVRINDVSKEIQKVKSDKESGKSEYHCLYPLTEGEAAGLKNSFNNFISSIKLKPEQSPFASALAGAWYEEQHLYTIAWLYYQKASTLAKGSGAFENLPAQFYQRLGIINP